MDFTEPLQPPCTPKPVKKTPRTTSSPYFKKRKPRTRKSGGSSPRNASKSAQGFNENQTHGTNANSLRCLVSFQPENAHIEAECKDTADSNVDFLNTPILALSPCCTSNAAEVTAQETPEISEKDIKWFKRETLRLEDPLYSFYLRKYTRLYFSLLQAKPVLVQERFSCDPWRLLVAVMFLNKTAGKVAIPVMWDVLNRWPTPETMSEANVDDLKSLITCLGLQETRAKRLKALSKSYIIDPPRTDVLRKSNAYIVPTKNELTGGEEVALVKQRYPPTPISHLPGTGPYAMDSYRIFCLPGDEWKSVMPTDKELIKYLRWKWAFHEHQRWDPVKGVTGTIQTNEIETLPAILAL